MNNIKRIFSDKKNLFLIFSGVFGVILVWRGLWGLMDLYLFPGHPEFSYILSIALGFFILLADDFELEELGSHRAVHHDEEHKTEEVKSETNSAQH